MTLQEIRERLEMRSLPPSEERIGGRPAVVGYDKQFRWRWIATQLNTFIVVSDFAQDEITVPAFEAFLTESFEYAKKHYSGWPRGLQSGMGVIGILLSGAINEDARQYCTGLKTGKKWAGFSIPVAVNTSTGEVFSFEKNPMWGRIYYPYFRELIDALVR
ncbi:MAG TPA: hypothetical protein ENJ18_12620 [Nannocystis exedens]|nr:hypothetical protein [Nannocystis exedens]